MINQKEYEKLLALLYHTANQLEKWSQDGIVIDNIIVGESLYDDARLDAIDARNEKRKRDATKDRIAAKKIKAYAKRKAEMLRDSKKNKSK